MLEKFLTTDEEGFQKYLRSHPGEEEMDNRREAYRYAQVSLTLSHFYSGSESLESDSYI